MKTLVPAPSDTSGDPFDLDLRTLSAGTAQPIELAGTGDCDTWGGTCWSCLGSTCGFTCGGRTGKPCAC
ncbi:hypothetical protein GA0070604_4011 [Micromonospora eburnea]|uniref:Uncharacterized protein n=1 Tax=Micromonospora eburnea TaxID=227316 RepID=A0A1C6UZ02_9ACTN|nr:hypothetical protein GA0070604_4011 [Micromonospora eburnea]